MARLGKLAARLLLWRHVPAPLRLAPVLAALTARASSHLLAARAGSHLLTARASSHLLAARAGSHLLAACAGSHLLAACAGSCLLAACASEYVSVRAPKAPEGPPTRVAVQELPTVLLSAQVLPPGPADRDYVLPVRAVVHLLFSRSIDPLTLAPQHFVLALADGRRIAPVGVFLTAGTGPGEQRSVALLIAAPPAATTAEADKTVVVTPPAEPFSVTIMGLLHDAQGRVLEGLASDIRPPGAPVVPVRAEPGPPAVCAGRGQTLRVFWSGPVGRAPSDPALAPVVSRMDGTRGPAELLAGSARPVMDLCAPGLASVRGVEFAAGAVMDERGLPAAGGALTISPGA